MDKPDEKLNVLRNTGVRAVGRVFSGDGKIATSVASLVARGENVSIDIFFAKYQSWELVNSEQAVIGRGLVGTGIRASLSLQKFSGTLDLTGPASIAPGLKALRAEGGNVQATIKLSYFGYTGKHQLFVGVANDNDALLTLQQLLKAYESGQLFKAIVDDEIHVFPQIFAVQPSDGVTKPDLANVHCRSKPP